MVQFIVPYSLEPCGINMNREEYIEIAGKLADGLATEHEVRQFNAYYNQYQSVYPEWDRVMASEKKAILDTMHQRINKTINEKNGGRRIRLTRWMSAIAAVLAIVVFGIYFFSQNSQQSIYKNDLAPGRNKAVLTLANGKKINLSDAKSGIVIKASQLTYTDGAAIVAIAGKKAEITTISTPRGGQYNIELPDGTTVALNAASTLKFPATFSGANNRLVELSGEGYFEVAKDKKHPFIVKSAGQEVEVLGTHFNLNAYADERAVATTLVEGSVKVSSGSHVQVIKPGEQALSNGSGIRVNPVNIENVTDWKEGAFSLNHLDFKSAMRKISRWYDVDVIYEGAFPDDMESGGWISRSNPLSAVLKLIESSGQVHFRLEGKKLYVSK